MMNGRLSGSVKNLKVGKAKTSGKACCDFDLISADDSTEVSLKYYGDSGAYLIKNCEDGDFVTISYALECRKNDSNRYELNLLCQGVEQSITDSQEEINEGFMRGYLKYAPDFNKRTETLTMWISTPSIGLDGFPRTYECKKTKEQRKDFTLIPLDITDSKIIKAIKKANLDKDDELSIYYTLESDKDGSLRIEVTDVKIIRRDSDNKEYPKGKGKKSSKNTTKNKSESYSEEDLEDMDKSELREVAKELGISYSRKDNEDTLIDKILEHLESDEEDNESESYSEEDLENMDKSELREVAKELGISYSRTDNEDTLIDKILEHLESDEEDDDSESYSEEDLENMDKSELREVAKELGISYSRTDNEDTLIDKILEHLESDEEDNESESYSEEDLENMDKSELREVAKELGISYSRTDNEDTLIDKILEHLESDEEDDDLIDNKSKSNKSKSSSKRTNKSSEDTGKKRVPNFVKKR